MHSQTRKITSDIIEALNCCHSVDSELQKHMIKEKKT